MPTFDVFDSFWSDYSSLSRREQDAFLEARDKFAEDCDSGDFRASLRVKPMKGQPHIWEMTWEGNNGRATSSTEKKFRLASGILCGVASEATIFFEIHKAGTPRGIVGLV